jgi:hypothetical protein
MASSVRRGATCGMRCQPTRAMPGTVPGSTSRWTWRGGCTSCTPATSSTGAALPQCWCHSLQTHRQTAPGQRSSSHAMRPFTHGHSLRQLQVHTGRTHSQRCYGVIAGTSSPATSC